MMFICEPFYNDHFVSVLGSGEDRSVLRVLLFFRFTFLKKLQGFFAHNVISLFFFFDIKL